MKNFPKTSRPIACFLLISILLITVTGCNQPEQQDPISTKGSFDTTETVATPSPTADSGEESAAGSNTAEMPTATSAATVSDPATTTAAVTATQSTTATAASTTTISENPASATEAATATTTTAATTANKETTAVSPTATAKPTATKTTAPKTATPKPTTAKPTTPKPTTPKPSTAKPTPTPQPTMQVNKNYAQQVLTLVNAERAKEGLKPLTMTNSNLIAAAELRAEECITLFSHTRPNGESCFTVLEEFQVSWWTVGENIAEGGYPTPEAVMIGWMNSPGHRANILTAEFTEIGIGCVSYNGVYYWAQLFIG